MRSLIAFVLGWPPRSVGMAVTGWVCWRSPPVRSRHGSDGRYLLYDLLCTGRRLEVKDAVVESTTSGSRPNTGRACALGCGCSSFEWGGGEHTLLADKFRVKHCHRLRIELCRGDCRGRHATGEDVVRGKWCQWL